LGLSRKRGIREAKAGGLAGFLLTVFCLVSLDLTALLPNEFYGFYRNALIFFFKLKSADATVSILDLCDLLLKMEVA
jgi:hypothetical protein